ncbi:hypothetical protein ASD78_18775 [Lysobacter sp. Root667]|uniref:hypothetical protein n=1 Tax=Lysobacter sp. Root667 TaxID=1736581 RepID=UPI0006FE387C|nr:hypothetical protein [Lysobacter sp. Root667]KRA79813.1 hypothetical protein ASD78_18775 [Lysobacter sp. Root667]
MGGHLSPVSRSRAVLAAGLCAALPATASAADFSGLTTIMFGIPFMGFSLLTFVVMLRLGRPSHAWFAGAGVLLCMLLLIGVFLFRDAWSLLGNRHSFFFGVVYFALFVGCIASFFALARKKDGDGDSRDGGNANDGAAEER